MNHTTNITPTTIWRFPGVITRTEYKVTCTHDGTIEPLAVTDNANEAKGHAFLHMAEVYFGLANA